MDKENGGRVCVRARSGVLANHKKEWKFIIFRKRVELDVTVLTEVNYTKTGRYQRFPLMQNLSDI